MRRRALPLILVLLAAFSAGFAASAAEIPLTAVLYPERIDVDVPLAVTAIGPATAKATATVYVKGGQSRIDLTYKGMAPAIAFGGDVTTYSLFAVTKDGVAENLGELVVTGAKGTARFTTGQKEFALVVTAEPVSGVQAMSTLVVLTSGPARPKDAKSTPFTFNRFGNDYYQGLVKPENPSIANLPKAKKSSEPVELVAARKLVEMADGMKLAPGTEGALAEAKEALAAAKKGGSDRSVTDNTSKAKVLASEAIRKTVRADYERMLAEQEAARVARLDTTIKQKAEVEAMLAQVKADKATVEAEHAKVKAERDELAGRLSQALGQVADTRMSAIGAVVSLPGISFQTNKAVLVRNAEMTLAKLAGVALVFPKVNFRIEGFTDASGTADANMKLSTARAKSVYELLKAQGIAAERMEFKGRGPESPVAENDTEKGRALNRRVEIIALTAN